MAHPGRGGLEGTRCTLEHGIEELRVARVGEQDSHVAASRPRRGFKHRAGPSEDALPEFDAHKVGRWVLGGHALDELAVRAAQIQMQRQACVFQQPVPGRNMIVFIILKRRMKFMY